MLLAKKGLTERTTDMPTVTITLVRLELVSELAPQQVHPVAVLFLHVGGGVVDVEPEISYLHLHQTSPRVRNHVSMCTKVLHTDRKNEWRALLESNGMRLRANVQVDPKRLSAP